MIDAAHVEDLERVMRRLELARLRVVRAVPGDYLAAAWWSTWNDVHVKLMLQVDWQARCNYRATNYSDYGPTVRPGIDAEGMTNGCCSEGYPRNQANVQEGWSG
jgi:hypothetical protein